MAGVQLVDWGPYIVAQADAAEAEARVRRSSIGQAKRKHDVSAGGGEVAPVGDARLAVIHACLDSFEGFPRSNGQKRFHAAFIQSALPHIYGPADFERQRERILRENSLLRVQYETLVCAPRRFGKTIAVSMFCAALLATCESMWISVFSTGQRASTSLLDTTAKFFRMLKDEGLCRGSEDRILKKNTEELWTRGDHPSDIRKMFSYPSSVKGLKGVGGKILILEEASRLDEKVFKEVILPLCAVQDTVLLGISTPLDESNFYSVMLDMKRPDGTPLFNVVTITLLCDDCSKAGLLQCPHKAELPAWKSGERQELIASLMAGDRNLYVQENLGIVVRKNNSAFARESIDLFAASRAPLVNALSPSHVYVSIDPCGGGPSEMAIVLSYFGPGNSLVIAGCESAAVTSDEAQEVLLGGFLTKLRDQTVFRHSHIVLVIERNFGGTVMAHRIANICASFTPISALTADTNSKLRRIGVVLDAEIKDRYRDSLALLLRTGMILLSDPFVTNKNEVEQKALLVAQLRNYKFELVDRATRGAPAPPRKLWGGKTAAMSDDLAIGVQMACFWPSVHSQSGDKCLVSCIG